MENNKKMNNLVKDITGITPLDVKINFLSKEAELPKYATDGSMGMDMKAVSVEYNEKLDCYLYHTGLAFEIPQNYGMLLFPRSSNRKTDYYLTNSVGVADSDYRGEIIFCYKSRISTYERIKLITSQIIIDGKFVDEKGNTWFSDGIRGFSEIKKKEIFKVTKERIAEMTKKMEFAPYKAGDKIGQLVIIPYPKINFHICNELSDTERGDGGFGSTGK